MRKATAKTATVLRKHCLTTVDVESIFPLNLFQKQGIRDMGIALKLCRRPTLTRQTFYSQAWCRMSL